MEFETPFDVTGRRMATGLTFYTFHGRTKLVNLVLSEGNGIDGKRSRRGVLRGKRTL